MINKSFYQEIIQELSSYSHKPGLVAVTKTRDIETIRALYDLGQRDFGENRVEELLEKSRALQELEIRWHFIGHIQSKKVKKLAQVKNLFAIHSVDRASILNEILSRFASGPIPKLFLQFNISGESEKQGLLSLSEVEALFEGANALSLAAQAIEGVMGMAPLRVTDQHAAAEQAFEKLASLNTALKGYFKSKALEYNSQISAGMSQDYLQALKYGSNWVRVGSKLFV